MRLCRSGSPIGMSVVRERDGLLMTSTDVGRPSLRVGSTVPCLDHGLWKQKNGKKEEKKRRRKKAEYICSLFLATDVASCLNFM